MSKSEKMREGVDHYHLMREALSVIHRVCEGHVTRLAGAPPAFAASLLQGLGEFAAATFAGRSVGYVDTSLGISYAPGPLKSTPTPAVTSGIHGRTLAELCDILSAQARQNIANAPISEVLPRVEQALAEQEQLAHERQVLATAIVDAATKLGITKGDQALNGPQVLLLLDAVVGEAKGPPLHAPIVPAPNSAYALIQKALVLAGATGTTQDAGWSHEIIGTLKRAAEAAIAQDSYLHSILNEFYTAEAKALAIPATTYARAVRWLVEELGAARANVKEQAERAQGSVTTPIALLLHCPACGERHVDRGEFARKTHHTHACQACGHVWRPAIEDTQGVQFLPGFKDDES